MSFILVKFYYWTGFTRLPPYFVQRVIMIHPSSAIVSVRVSSVCSFLASLRSIVKSGASV